MKKLLLVFFTAAALLFGSALTVGAEDFNMIYDTSPIYESLSDEVKQSLKNMGIDGVDADSISALTFEKIVAEIADLASQNAASPLKGLVTITALMLLCSLLSAYKGSLSADVSSTLSIASTACIVCALAAPTVALIGRVGEVISASSNVMLAYVPIMVTLMSASGQAISGASYYTVMIAAGEGIGQLSSKVIVPLLNIFLGLSITGSVSPDINLGGFTKLISKTVKWLLAFAMTIFTSLLSLKQIISTSLDSVATKALKFSLSSFIPVVGSALSDAYKTVQGGVGVLKSGVGVFVIISVAIVFIPVILQCLMWIASLWVGKATAEVLNLSQAQRLLESMGEVFSTLLAVLLCIMSVYIISTVLILMMGGAGG